VNCSESKLVFIYLAAAIKEAICKAAYDVTFEITYEIVMFVKSKAAAIA